MQPEQEIITRWKSSAPFWEKHRHVIRAMFAPITQALIEDAGIASGDSILDVATGPGEPALSVAGAVGPKGKVFGVDLIQGMVAAARSEAGRLGLKNAKFAVASADNLPFAVAAFDGVISRFGVMFFPSPLQGLREMLRVLKPGRKLALAVWHYAEKNPFHYALSRIIDRYVDSPPAAPDALDAFRFAQPGKLKSALAEAGALNPSERLLEFRIEAPVGIEDFWSLRQEMSDKLRDKMSRLSKAQVAAVQAEMLEALKEYSRERGMSFPGEVLIVSGARGTG